MKILHLILEIKYGLGNIITPRISIMKITFQSETARIQKIMLKNAKAGFINQAFIDKQWESLNYFARPDFAKAQEEYQKFIQFFENNGIEVHLLTQNENLSIDSVYCRDASILTDKGAVLCRMGKERRRGEPAALGELYEQLGIPVLGVIEAPGMIEGGDTNWIDESTLAVGRGYRTNASGIEQLKSLLKEHCEIVEVALPHYKGPSDVFHLMSILSPIDDDLFLVYSPLMPVPFRELLLSKGIELIELPDEEFESMGSNVLAIAPRKCLMTGHNPVTKARLEAAGAEVFVYEGVEISEKGCGGPTCLTRPLERVISE